MQIFVVYMQKCVFSIAKHNSSRISVQNGLHSFGVVLFVRDTRQSLFQFDDWTVKNVMGWAFREMIRNGYCFCMNHRIRLGIKTKMNHATSVYTHLINRNKINQNRTTQTNQTLCAIDRHNWIHKPNEKNKKKKKKRISHMSYSFWK